MERFVTVLVLALILGFFARRSKSQEEARQSSVNECRHVAILARAGFDTSYTARCFIPTERTYSNSVSLFDMIPKEWKWIISHNGAITGQILVRTDKSVHILSQKDCLDVGEAQGRPYRSVYEQLGNKSPRTGVYGDFDFSDTSSQDAYTQCVTNNAQWPSFRRWKKNDSLPSDLIQMVRIVRGGHTGAGQQLIPFNFTYTKKQLNDAFRVLIDEALQNRPVQNYDELNITSGTPIMLRNGYPFETGISIIGPRPIGTRRIFVRDFVQDISNLAWNRALQAKSALSKRQDPPAPLPAELKTGELVSITVLSVVAVVLFGRSLLEAVRMRQTAVKEWNNPTGAWARLSYVGERHGNFGAKNGIGSVVAFLRHLFFSKTRGSPKGCRAGTVDILLAFVTGIASMTAAFLEFHESAYRYQKVLVVNAGGLVTYGPSNPTEYSIDLDNPWSGAEFSVNHWMVVNINTMGFWWLEPVVYVVGAILLLYMLRVFFVFSLRREHQLDFWIMRKSFFPVKWTILFFQKLLALGLLELFERDQDVDTSILISYETTYHAVFNILADSFGHERMMPGERPNACQFFSVFERLNIDRFLPDLDGPVQQANPNDGFKFINMNRRVSRNEIEKCAEVLAADRFGLLEKEQALTLMYTESAAKAADRFISEKQLPDANEISQLALIYYVRHVVIPDGDGQVVRRNEIEFINVSNGVRGAGGRALNPEHILAPNNGRTLGAVIGHRPRLADRDEAVNVMRENANANGNVIVNDNGADEWENWDSGNVIYVGLR